MDSLIFTFTKHNKGKNIVDCKVTGDYAQKMFCSSVGQSFANMWKGKEEAVEGNEIGLLCMLCLLKYLSVKLILTAEESIEELDATAPSIADTDQHSASLPKLATRKRSRESFTTPEENMDPNISPVAPQIRVYTARSTRLKKVISTTEPEQNHIPAVVTDVQHVLSTHLVHENQGKKRKQFLIHLSDVDSQVITVDIPPSWKGSEEELCNKVKSIWEKKVENYCCAYLLLLLH